MPAESELLNSSRLALYICFALAIVCAFMSFFIVRQGTLGLLVLYLAIIIIVEQNTEQPKSIGAPILQGLSSYLPNDTRWLHAAGFVNALMTFLVIIFMTTPNTEPLPDWVTYSRLWTTCMLLATVFLWCSHVYVDNTMIFSILATIFFAIGYILILIQYTIVSRFKTDG